MSGKTSQRKGRAGELELARLLQGYGYDVQPGWTQSYGEVPDLTGLLRPNGASRCDCPNGWPRPSGMLTASKMERRLGSVYMGKEKTAVTSRELVTAAGRDGMMFDLDNYIIPPLHDART